MLAHWHIDARFGHKDDVVRLIQRWKDEIAPQVGLDGARSRMMIGSVGAQESRVISEFEVDGMRQLEDAFRKLQDVPAHAEWGKELEPHVVSGTNHWELLRVV